MRTYSRFCTAARHGVLLLATTALALPVADNVPAHRAAAETRAAELRAQIVRADELYFKKAAPEISDAAYDDLKRELASIEHAFPELARPADAAIGDDRTGDFQTARHRARMLSLKKAYSEAELRAFVQGLEKQLRRGSLAFVVEPKFDGVAISVTYRNGKFDRAVTRGNGDEGDDVSDNVRAIRALPLTLEAPKLPRPAAKLKDSFPLPDLASAPLPLPTLPVPTLIELRGEIFVSYPEFRRINAEQEELGLELFSHPRNLAAGTLKRHDAAALNDRRLEMVFYGIGACEPADESPRSQMELHAALRAWRVPGARIVRAAHGADEIWQAIQALAAQRDRLPFPIDGAVVKLDDFAAQQQLGASAGAPNWAIAYKFPTGRVSTRLRSITLQLGRTGVLTPVAELDPVELNGSVVRRATLHNRDEIRRHDLRVGDYVFVERAGEVIPAIVGVDVARRTEASEPYSFPEHCPACATALLSAPGAAAVRCPNDDCPAQLKRRLEHFAGKTGVEIGGLGPATVAALVDAGVVRTPADLFTLDADKLDVVSPKSAERLLAEIERARQAELWRYLQGLSIPGVGRVAARELALGFDDLGEIVRASEAEMAQRCPRVGRNTAAAVIAFFAQEKNRRMIATMTAAGVRPQRSESAR
ncbi:MAG TPA: NAD-dependent DNA ligase LigA [Opitutus sp.]|nr:NAD-dependent DNA ligase LigA [Opitutus sp.]